MPDLMAERTAADTAFAALLEQHRDRAMALLRRLCRNDADDLLQDTMVRAWRYRDRCDVDGNVAGWLLQVAFRSFLDHRDKTRRQAVADEATVQQASHAPKDGVALQDELRRALQRLSELQKVLLLGFHREQLSLQQLAERHAMPLNTVKSHLHRARQLLVQPDLEDRR